MIVPLSQLSKIMQETAAEVVAGLKGMCDENLEVEEPEFLDFQFQIVTGINSIERVQTSAQGDRTTITTQEKTTVDQTHSEQRANSGGQKSTTTYEWEDDD